MGNRPGGLTIYGREGCHLCEDMVDAVRVLQTRYHFTLELIDVDEDETLRLRYGPLVPVLTGSEGEELCHYFFDPAVVDAYLAKIR